MVKDHDALGAGIEPGLDVELLERLAVPVRERDQAHEQQHGGGVLPGGVQAHVGVGRPGPAGHHGDARALVHFAVGLGHVGGAALVPADDGFNVGVVQPVQDVQEALAGNHVGAFHAVGHERINNHVPGGFQCRAASAWGRPDGWPAGSLDREFPTAAGRVWDAVRVASVSVVMGFLWLFGLVGVVVDGAGFYLKVSRVGWR